MSAWQASGIFVLLCSVLAANTARRTPLEDAEDVEEKIYSARCASRCLTLQVTQLRVAFKHLQSDQVLVWCENHRRCSQCLQPCKELWEARKTQPPKPCEKQTECVTSREFLASLRAARQGDCPLPQRAAGFAAACVESCSSDQHCPAPRKCCANGCGHTCQAPANLYKGVPLKPRRDMNFLEDSEGRVKVMWMSKFNVSVEPVVYMLQSRWNRGIHPSEDHASPWNTVAMTLSEHAVLSEMRPQRWYQFRVAAINSHGSRGFTTPSKHYISSRDPSPPESPINIRVANQTLGRARSFTARGDGVTVGALLNWEPPSREGDLPVHHYRVAWTPGHTLPRVETRAPRKNGPAPSRRSGQDKKGSSSKLTRGAQCELWLQGLLPATSYFLSVQTVAYWGPKRLKSPRSHIVFTTISVTERKASSLPGITKEEEDFSNELPFSSSVLTSSSDRPGLSALPRPDDVAPGINPSNLRLEAAAPHYHDDQLQVKVFWKFLHQGRHMHPGPYALRWRPHACSADANATGTEKSSTVQGTHHTIKGLNFSCKYRVAVAIEGDPGSESVAWVMTPACSSIRVRGRRAVHCDDKERPLPGRKVVLRPERLTADFHEVNGSLHATFRWRLSQHVPEQHPIEGFQFVWTQLDPPSGVSVATEGQEDTLISQSQIVAPSQRSVTVSGLHGDSIYQLQLQVLTEGGSSGPAVSKTIHTPTINTTLLL